MLASVCVYIGPVYPLYVKCNRPVAEPMHARHVYDVPREIIAAIFIYFIYLFNQNNHDEKVIEHWK